ncbi:hypothetical protein K502DRAFT_367425 [Neoconidiobolus thromboides FSU 785]|nr:hypothetical protein K502DRAFT_367425 [Neoconidiobolus thromboides FSU 785]
MGFFSCFSCLFGSTSDTDSISEKPLMKETPSMRENPKRYSIRPSPNKIKNQPLLMDIIGNINPFTTSVQCTVSAKSQYPSRKDLVRSRADTESMLDSHHNLHLHFRPGDSICILGQTSSLLVGYLEKDSQRTLGVLSPNLVFVNLASVKTLEPPQVIPSPVIATPHQAYSSRRMTP